MRSLVVDDELISRMLLQKLLAPLGECHIAVNGKEAIEAFLLADETRQPYDLICLDIMMPGIDGQKFFSKFAQWKPTKAFPKKIV